MSFAPRPVDSDQGDHLPAAPPPMLPGMYSGYKGENAPRSPHAREDPMNVHAVLAQHPHDARPATSGSGPMGPGHLAVERAELRAPHESERYHVREAEWPSHEPRPLPHDPAAAPSRAPKERSGLDERRPMPSSGSSMQLAHDGPAAMEPWKADNEPRPPHRLPGTSEMLRSYDAEPRRTPVDVPSDHDMYRTESRRRHGSPFYERKYESSDLPLESRRPVHHAPGAMHAHPGPTAHHHYVPYVHHAAMDGHGTDDAPPESAARASAHDEQDMPTSHHHTHHGLATHALQPHHHHAFPSPHAHGTAPVPHTHTHTHTHAHGHAHAHAHAHHHHHHYHHHHHRHPVEASAPPRNVSTPPAMEHASDAPPATAETHHLAGHADAGAELVPLTPLELKLRELSSGPRVDNEPVWQYLDRCEQLEDVTRQEQKRARLWKDAPPSAGAAEAPPAASAPGDGAPAPADKAGPLYNLGLDRGRAVRHLGSFLYDPTGNSPLPAELLLANMGATIEIRIPGTTLGLGTTEAEWRTEEARLQAEVLARMEHEAEEGREPSLALERTPASLPLPEEYRGRWRLGWRGLEHARINREIRLSQAWHEHKALRQLDPRAAQAPLRVPEPRAPAVVKTRQLDEATLEQAAWDFWRQPGLDQRKLWGTDVYTDDSDVLAMCVHAGWIEAPHIPGVPEWLSGGGGRRVAKAWVALSERQAEQAPRDTAALPPVHIAPDTVCDLSVMLRIAPKLILYKGCHRGGVQSRSWGNTHDGVSLVVESVELRAPHYATSFGRRSLKQRMNQMNQLRRVAEDTAPPASMPAATHGLTALSALCPAGERAFWDAASSA